MKEKMKSASDIVALARQIKRGTPLDYFETLFTGFFECHGDRLYGDDQAVVGGIAYLEQLPVTVIGIQKGHDLKENIVRNFGSPHPEGYRKAQRLMKQAEKFERPVITFINTPGAFCGIEAEERGEGEAIAQCLLTLSDLTVPTIAVFIGEGGSGGALALGVADKVIMLEHSIYSILSPEGFASILWKDAKRAPEAADLMKLTAPDLKKLKVIDYIIPETSNGEPLPQTQITQRLKQELVALLTFLKSRPLDVLLETRYQRFRDF